MYRSGLPSPVNFSFLSTLNLRTIILLSHAADDALIGFAVLQNIKLICIDSSIHQSFDLSEEMVVSALKVISDETYLPCLISCRTGRSLTGAVVGCIRKLQRWSLVSIFEEYRRFASYSGTKIQRQHEQFIELFDTDLLPLSSSTPKFLRLSS